MAVNPQRGEVAIRVDGREHVMRLTLGALAELEARLKVTSLLGLAEKFETGGVATAELIALLAAGIGGGGGAVTEDELAVAEIEGGAVGAMKAGLLLLSRTFQPEMGQPETGQPETGQPETGSPG
ncbi:MAG: gene transfer agent family protein [Proteobacteria bacterium]|nr:gene transfer agent family protein [Pseudomonadota bacterium]